MSRREGARSARPLRVLVLVLLGTGPFLAGAVHEPVFVPLLAGCVAAGLWALWRARRAGDEGSRVPPLPGGRLLLALHALVLFQLVPLPPSVLGLVSPGSFSCYADTQLVPLTAWRPISVSPPDTLRGLAFLAGFSMLYLAVFREMTEAPWRRRLLRTVVGVGVALSVVAFVQAASPEPRRIYGLWRPQWDWAVFGPYVNRNHFAGYLVMAAPLAIGFALEAISRLRAAWGRRRHGWLLLGESEGNAVLRGSAVVMVIVAGLVASRSRGAVSAFALAALVLPLVSRHRWRTALVVSLLIGLGLAWIGVSDIVSAFEARGIRRSRLDLWHDALSMVPRFPIFGDGWNAFATAFPWYQTVWKSDWVGEAHNDYLQALIDGGAVGAALVAALLLVVFRGALARATLSPLDLGLFGALLGLALHGLVDFNGQIPANAATWIALAAVAVPCASREPAAPLKREGSPPRMAGFDEPVFPRDGAARV
jgi:putative inorganic carbon (HCO3(-)) transporter